LGTRLKNGSAFLYDDVTDDIVGVRDVDGNELLFMRIPHAGSFCSNNTQTVTANTATAVSLNTTILSKGISVVDSSKITVSRKALYNIQFSMQLDRTNSGVDAVSIWLRKNGQDLANTNTIVTVSGSANAAKLVAAWNLFSDAVAGDYFQLMWSSPDAQVRLHYEAAQSNPTRPTTPSVILTVNEVDGSYP
jgi:hypothetical protein